MSKEATQLGDISINKPAWRLMIDAVISVINSIKESSVHLIVKGITSVCLMAIVSFTIIKAITIVGAVKGAGIVIFISIIAATIALAIIWIHDQ